MDDVYYLTNSDHNTRCEHIQNDKDKDNERSDLLVPMETSTVGEHPAAHLVHPFGPRHE